MTRRTQDPVGLPASEGTFRATPGRTDPDLNLKYPDTEIKVLLAIGHLTSVLSWHSWFSLLKVLPWLLVLVSHSDGVDVGGPPRKGSLTFRRTTPVRWFRGRSGGP